MQRCTQGKSAQCLGSVEGTWISEERARREQIETYARVIEHERERESSDAQRAKRSALVFCHASRPQLLGRGSSALYSSHRFARRGRGEIVPSRLIQPSFASESMLPWGPTGKDTDGGWGRWRCEGVRRSTALAVSAKGVERPQRRHQPVAVPRRRPAPPHLRVRAG